MNELKQSFFNFFLKKNTFVVLATGTQSDGEGFFLGGREGICGGGDGVKSVGKGRIVRHYSLYESYWEYKNVHPFFCFCFLFFGGGGKWEEVGVLNLGTNL